MIKKVKVNAGPAAATELLSGLDSQSREKVIRKMSEIDPELTEALLSQLISLDELPKMTPKMLQDFLKRVVPDDLVLALKVCQASTGQFFLDNANRSLVREIQESKSGAKVPKSKCIEAQDRVLEVMKKMIDEGSLILDNSDDYV